jgi:hypothetical protein
MHKRQAIRDAVVSQLMDKTSAWSRVFPTRQVPWRRADLPGISVYALEEEEENGKRKMRLAVLLVVALTEQVDVALDDLALEVETALNADLSFGAMALGSRYTGMMVEITEDQGIPLGAMRLTYETWYLTA